jgi:transposase, IS5 family
VGSVIRCLGQRGAGMSGQAGFFDLDDRYRTLSAAGDALERLARAVDLELFRPELEAALQRSDRAKGGRPPYDAVLMFKVLVLQTLHTLSDDQTEYQLRDRLSFMRFVGLALHDPVPDAKTIWLFREQLTRTGAIERLFRRFDAALRDQGLLAMGGQILDATVVQARPARLTAEEKTVVRDGKTPAGWSPARRAQIDRDARWTLKRGRKRPLPEDGTSQHGRVEIAVPVFGYKSHIGVDRKHGLIRTWTVTHAAAHDGGQLANLLDASNTASGVWADTAYRSAANLAALAKRGLTARLQRPKPRGKPMPPHVRRGNATRGKIRAAVEHVFACQKQRLRLVVRTVGLARATSKFGLANLAYNLLRFVWLQGRGVPA